MSVVPTDSRLVRNALEQLFDELCIPLEQYYEDDQAIFCPGNDGGRDFYLTLEQAKVVVSTVLGLECDVASIQLDLSFRTKWIDKDVRAAIEREAQAMGQRKIEHGGTPKEDSWHSDFVSNQLFSCEDAQRFLDLLVGVSGRVEVFPDVFVRY